MATVLVFAQAQQRCLLSSLCGPSCGEWTATGEMQLFVGRSAGLSSGTHA